MEQQNSSRRSFLDFMVLCALAVFTALQFFGDFPAFHLIANNRCYPVLGCNAGFFGYDALIHFFAGVLELSLLVWFMRHYARFNVMHKEFWKTVVVLVAMVAFLAVAWEAWEFSVDHFKMDVLHMNLISPVNVLLQPTNSDTMGDIVCTILGSMAGLSILKKFDAHVIGKDA